MRVSIGVCLMLLQVLKVAALAIYMSFGYKKCLFGEELTFTIPVLACAALVFWCVALCILGVSCYRDSLFYPGVAFFLIQWILTLALWIDATTAADEVDDCCYECSNTDASDIEGQIDIANILMGILVVGEPILVFIACCAM